MRRNQALSILLRHREELIALGVESLSLVGSVAREESDVHSDVDIVVRLAGDARGLAHFRRLDELGERLGEILGCRVDLMEEAAVSRRMLREIQRDRVL